MACAARAGASAPLPTVERVDLERYAGTWYEIAHLPFRFQAGCHGTTATYTPRQDGRLEVVNRCRDGSLEGRVRESKGRAWPTDESGAKLRVSFFGPFSAPYWILRLDEDYQYAMVGVPNRKYLWLLSRTPSMSPNVFADYVRWAAERGFDVERLIITPQPGVDPGIYEQGRATGAATE